MYSLSTWAVKLHHGSRGGLAGAFKVSFQVIVIPGSDKLKTVHGHNQLKTVLKQNKTNKLNTIFSEFVGDHFAQL